MLYFPNLVRPKKAAKRLASNLSVALHAGQRAVARACGFRDWHDLEHRITSGLAFTLDQLLSSNEFVERQTAIVLSIARDLSIADGDVQFALASAGLTGDRSPQLEEQIAIRLECYRATSLPLSIARQPGAIGRLRTAGRNGEVVILRKIGRPTEVLSHRAISTVSDFEYVSPRKKLSLFIPDRLHLPYGYWTEANGSRVLFSRDYKPMWRIRLNGEIERLEPWLWISHTGETHLWPGNEAPWNSPTLKSRMLAFLAENRIFWLPILADALPLLVHATSSEGLSYSKGASLLQVSRTGMKP